MMASIMAVATPIIVSPRVDVTNSLWLAVALKTISSSLQQLEFITRTEFFRTEIFILSLFKVSWRDCRKTAENVGKDRGWTTSSVTGDFAACVYLQPRLIVY